MIIKLIVMCCAHTVVRTYYDVNLIIDHLKKKPQKAAMLVLPTKR